MLIYILREYSYHSKVFCRKRLRNIVLFYIRYVSARGRSGRESLISQRFVLLVVSSRLVSSERSLLAEESSQCRVNAHNFTLRRPLGIGLLDRISRRKEEEELGNRCHAATAKGTEWMSLGGRSFPEGPSRLRRSLREA